MTREEQIRFIQDLCTNICGEVVKRVLAGKIPEEWDGQELRCLLADKFEDSASMSIIRREKRGRRKSEYRNTCTINNL